MGVVLESFMWAAVVVVGGLCIAFLLAYAIGWGATLGVAAAVRWRIETEAWAHADQPSADRP